MDKIVIRKISIEDLHGLQKISRQTFQEAFAQDNSEANMQKYLDANLSESQLTVELFNPQSEFYFAELGMDVLGYMKLNKGSAQTEQLGEEGLEIERIYVLSKCYGLGVGAALYN
ncbi:MAG: GNAT family N-acetyltransferase, partial [Sphingobacteriales bacterium]